jgi:hypothetical protein
VNGEGPGQDTRCRLAGGPDRELVAEVNLRQGVSGLLSLRPSSAAVEAFREVLRLVRMEWHERKPRRTETPVEREARLAEEARKAVDQALAEQDELDAMVRRSIAAHGA